MPQFLCPGLVVDQEELVTSQMFATQFNYEPAYVPFVGIADKDKALESRWSLEKQNYTPSILVFRVTPQEGARTGGRRWPCSRTVRAGQTCWLSVAS